MAKKGQRGSQYIIGIDLGTTNCTMSYTQIGDENKEIVSFPIPQTIAPNRIEGSLSLPSFLYFPLEEELEKKLTAIDWAPDQELSIGLFARERGAELPNRVIGSAKSWLCHPGIDRREKLLPLEFDGDKLSPLESCAEILQHLRHAWDSSMHNAPFTEQQIFVTVPASFDPAARQLVQEAAESAGYPEIVLLEEPQAAFYAWLEKNEETWRKILKVGDTILVADIGGGTSDFSLISLIDDDGNMTLERLAVGSHLLLGGDNIDLALAYLAKRKLEDAGKKVDDWQMQSLVHSCRQAKEELLKENPPKNVPITLMGRGSRLIGGSIKTSIDKLEAEELILDGFLPKVPPTEQSASERRLGIQEVGLPYAQDARISCQLAKFLSMKGESDGISLDKFLLPSYVLFNGGTMKSSALRKRFVEVINLWAQELGRSPTTALEEPDYDHAVSRGAVYYGLARNGEGIRIRSGTSRNYFIGVEEAAPAVPGIQPQVKAICVVPFGMEEGTEQALEGQEFALVLGEQAAFRFFSTTAPSLLNGTAPQMGTVIRNWKDELKENHPVEALLEGQVDDGKTVKVKLKSKVTELGVLELWCVAPDSREWKLEFDLRHEK